MSTPDSTNNVTPYFSVVIPTYRRPELLIQAMASVAEQTFTDYEIIVVDDDGQSARTAVESFAGARVRYFENDHASGGAGTRNAGIDRARGRWVAFLDDDDTWLPRKLERIHELIEASEDPDLVLVYSGNIKYDHEAATIVSTATPKVRGRALSQFLYSNCVGGASVAVAHRTALTAVSGFDERFPSLQDMELYVRLAELGTVDFVDEPLVRIRSSSRVRITYDPHKKLQGAILFAQKYAPLMRRSLRLRHRAASRAFVFAVAAKQPRVAARFVPLTLAGILVDPGNVSYVVKSMLRLSMRGSRPIRAIGAAGR